MKQVTLKINSIEEAHLFYEKFKNFDATVGSVDRKYTLPIDNLSWFFTLDLTRPVILALLETDSMSEKMFDILVCQFIKKTNQN